MAEHLKRNPIFKGLLSAVILSIILVLILSILFNYTSLSENNLASLVNIIIILSVFGGSYISSKIASTRVLFVGIGVGLLYLLLTFICCLFLKEAILFSNFFVKAVYCLLSGIFGSLIGVSFK